MSDKLILHPTSCAQWQALLAEAQFKSAVSLNTEIESYLVFLLMRFASKPELAKSILGLEFLQCTEKAAGDQPLAFKEVGDKCLLFSGLFPEHAQKRKVTLSYFIRLGQSAYHCASEHYEPEGKLFTALCGRFPELTDVLNAMRFINQEVTPSLFQMIERWQDFQSNYALHTIQDNLEASPCYQQPGKRPSKH